MKNNSIFKVLVMFTLVFILTVALSNLNTKQYHYTAGDDLPIYIGTSAPRG